MKTYSMVVLMVMIAAGSLAENPRKKAVEFEIHLDSVKWTISDYLVGMHSVYSFEPDSLLSDGQLDKWLKYAGINTMRYPGGTIVKYWDWKKPTGDIKVDSWDPEFDSSQVLAPELWRSLDEYLATAKKANLTPLLGVNITSGYRFGRVEESVARAAEMVQYVKDQGFGGAFWYLGNEGMNGGLESEANLFVLHAKAMKAVDPGIKCMFNHNDLTPKYLKRYLAIAGDYIDIAETHGKWPFGGNPKGYDPASLEEWKVERPLRDRKNHNRAWRHEADSLRAAAATLGRPDILFANNEYGMGSPINLKGFDNYTKSLLMIDMLQEHFLGNWYMACYWSTILPNNKGMINTSKYPENRMYAMSHGFDMLAKAQGADMLLMTDDNNPSVYGFAAKKDGILIVYILNKSDKEQKVEINTKGQKITSETGLVRTLVNSSDRFGKTSVKQIDVKSDMILYQLPPLSYSQFSIKL